jgi:hypothetical protein
MNFAEDVVPEKPEGVATKMTDVLAQKDKMI